MNRRDHELAAHHPWLHRLARRLARSRTRADDLVQDTCITALRNAPPDVQLRPWLRAVMRKLAWGQVRSERRRSQREEGYSVITPTMTLPDVFLGHGIARERLIAALARLPEPFHSTIVQRFIRGRSCADIARSENVPAGTVRWRQARGLELLRAELTPPRRRQFALWGLPIVGAGERLVARVWQTLATRGSSSKAIWLWLACAAMIYAISGSDEPRRGPTLGVAPTRDAEATVGASPGLSETFTRAGDDNPESVLAARPLRVAGVIASLVADIAPDRTRTERHESALAPLDTHRDNCRWDPVNGWRCSEASSSSAMVDSSLCERVHQQILAGEALALAAPTARSFVTAAMQANRALARSLDCPPVGADPSSSGGAGGGRAGARGGGGGGGGKAGCVTQPGTDGATCTVCPGERPVCAPAECHARLRDDGVVCTTCVDVHGETRSDCPEEPPTACHSRLARSGLVCTSCEDQPGQPECLPAECMVIDRCLRCVDPKGRVGVDCSVDYEVLRAGSLSTSADSVFFSSCTFSWGVIPVSGTTCHYPGLQSCAVSQTDGWHCLECDYPDGSWQKQCSDPSLPLPDPLVDRPLDLPAPGTCASELGSDGMVACATCTREDLSATTSCHYTGMASCDVVWDQGYLGECQRVDGSRVRVQNSTRGPRPSEADAHTDAHVTPTPELAAAVGVENLQRSNAHDP